MPEDPPSAKPRGAVFLSYASQDADAAKRIAQALRASTVDVWLDMSELAGGDAWDAKIRGQIGSCALFIPVISASTNARLEGYFRREWKLAVERTDGMDQDLPFLVPVVIDGTTDTEARVPERFRKTHWTRLPQGETPQEFRSLIVRLLAGGAHVGASPAPTSKAPGHRRQPQKAMLVFAAIAAAVIVAAVSAYVAFRQGPSPSTIAGPVAAPRPVTVLPKSIAVLPFVNMSDSKENAYFADGMQEDILTSLSLIGDLNVISRTSVMGYRDSTKTVQRIAGELGVAYVLEGSVRKSDKKVRVTGQLIDGRTGLHVWARSYDRDLDDVFAIQAELSKEIAEALHSVLTPKDLARLDTPRTESSEAYDLYLRARSYYLTNDTWPNKVAKAQPLLERAVELDPEFVDAWLELHWIYSELQRFNSSPAILAKKDQALANAVRLAPNSANVLSRLLYVADGKNDAAEANELKKRLLVVNPKAAIDFQIGDAMQADDVALAAALMEKKRSLDPRNGELLDELGRFYMDARKFESAQAVFAAELAVGPPSTWTSFRLALVPFLKSGETAQMEAFQATLSAEALRNDPVAISVRAIWDCQTGDAAGLVQLWKNSGSNWNFEIFSHEDDLHTVGMAYRALGRDDLARPVLIHDRDLVLAELANSPDDVGLQLNLCKAEALLGEIPEARAAGAKVIKLWPDLSDKVALALVWSGEKADKEAAIAILDREMKRKTASIWSFNVHMAARSLETFPLQGDPRFQALLRDPANNLSSF